jgi:hypothetical protein
MRLLGVVRLEGLALLQRAAAAAAVVAALD